MPPSFSQPSHPDIPSGVFNDGSFAHVVSQNPLSITSADEALTKIGFGDLQESQLSHPTLTGIKRQRILKSKFKRLQKARDK